MASTGILTAAVGPTLELSVAPFCDEVETGVMLVAPAGEVAERDVLLGAETAGGSDMALVLELDTTGCTLVEDVIGEGVNRVGVSEVASILGIVVELYPGDVTTVVPGEDEDPGNVKEGHRYVVLAIPGVIPGAKPVGARLVMN